MPKDDAHEIALELLRQLIALSAGVIALSATFIEEFRTAATGVTLVLALSWVVLAGSIYSGLQGISAIVKSRLEANTDWSRGVGQSYASWSKGLFLAGIVAFALFAFLAVLLPAVAAPQACPGCG